MQPPQNHNARQFMTAGCAASLFFSRLYPLHDKGMTSARTITTQTKDKYPLASAQGMELNVRLR
jgi:hypothetical protein